MDAELTTTLRYYKCWRCHKTFLDENIGGLCPDNHTPGECCHFAEMEIRAENYDCAMASVSNN